MALMRNLADGWRRGKASAGAVRVLTGFYELPFSDYMSQKCLEIVSARGYAETSEHDIALIYLVETMRAMSNEKARGFELTAKFLAGRAEEAVERRLATSEYFASKLRELAAETFHSGEPSPSATGRQAQPSGGEAKRVIECRNCTRRMRITAGRSPPSACVFCGTPIS